MTSKDSEKRKYQRMGVECEVSFAVGPEPDERKRHYLTVPAKDLSAEAIALDCPKELEKGTFLHLRLNFIRKSSVIKLRGEVTRCAPHGKRYTVGVKFFGSEASLSKILLPCL